MIPAREQNGHLPLGRFPCTLDELRKEYGWNGHRQTLLDELEEYLSLWEDDVPISRVWIGGSFLTSKENPGDIDVTVIVRERNLATAESVDFFKTMVSLAGPDLKAQTGLRIDQYPMLWPDFEQSADSLLAQQYCQNRGYWDDWWSRERATGADQVRGYLEVSINGNR